MESFENDPLVPAEMHDDELSAALQLWHSPPVPPRLRHAVFAETPPAWWKRAWATSVRVPAPVAVALLALFVVAAWRGAFWSAARIETPRVQSKLRSQAVSRDANVKSPKPSLAPKHASAWRLVTDLRPRVIPDHGHQSR